MHNAVQSTEQRIVRFQLEEHSFLFCGWSSGCNLLQRQLNSGLNTAEDALKFLANRMYVIFQLGSPVSIASKVHVASVFTSRKHVIQGGNPEVQAMK